MDFSLSEQQHQMQSTARDLVESLGGIEPARDVMAGDTAVVDDLWAKFADLDYTALTVPVKYGGLGDGMVNLSVLLEAFGRYATPIPYMETAAVVVPLLDVLGTVDQKDEYLPAIADGDLQFAVAMHDDANETLPASVQLEATPTDDGFRLSGEKTLVPFAKTVDRLLVVARTQDGTGYQGLSLFVVDPSAMPMTQLDSLDETRPKYEVTFDDIAVDEASLVGPLHGGGDAFHRAVDRFRVATCISMVGGAERAVELSVEQGNEREQYGNPVGMYQAVKHRTADMWMDKEQARGLAYYAAWAIETDDPDASRAASAAMAFCGERLRRVFADNIKNHGGTGFTWDHDGHIYFKQAKSWETLFGSKEDHLDQVIAVRQSSD